LALIRELGIPVYDSLERAVRCVEALAEFGEAQRRASPPDGTAAKRGSGFEEVIARCRREGRTVVLEHEARQALQDAGVRMTAPAMLARTPDEALRVWRELGSAPVAIKVVSRDVIHKTDAGGVKLNVADEAAVRQAYAEIVAGCTRYLQQHEKRDPAIAGVLVTPMAPKGGVEVIIGVVRDPSYGPVLMFGLGGVLVEVLKDVVFRSLPLTAEDAHSMLGEIRAAKILDGVRGAPPIDKEALVELMLAISQLCTAFPEIDELDLNPVLAYPNGVGILDARILLRGE